MLGLEPDSRLKPNGLESIRLLRARAFRLDLSAGKGHLTPATISRDRAKQPLARLAKPADRPPGCGIPETIASNQNRPGRARGMDQECRMAAASEMRADPA